MKLIESIVVSQAEIRAVRRDLHAHPEIAYEENRTADIVAQKLEAWGIEVHRGLGKTGVVGTITGKKQNGRSIGLRADMDALPMQELNTFEHASTHPGKMHACGHDGHTAMLLAAAQHLAQNRDFDGTVYVIFQPAEEGGAGAKKMIDDGLFTLFPMQAVFGMHNTPGMPVGSFGVAQGPAMASSNTFRIVITGVGAHAARPHMGVDPLMPALQLGLGLQSIISRNHNPLDPAAVLSLTQLHAGSADNVIPETAELRGTVRTFSEAALDMIEKRIGELTHSICAAFNCQVDFTFNRQCPPVVNHPAETAFSVSVLQDVFGKENVDPVLTPTMGSEDFSFMLKEKPGCYIRIGAGQGDHRLPGHGDGPCLVHNASYDFNDELIPIGGTYWVELAKRWLAS